MTTAIDTNVIVALWDIDPVISGAAGESLDEAAQAGQVVVSPPVYCELMAAPHRSREFVNQFMQDTGLIVDWDLPVNVWDLAADAFRAYAQKRRKGKEPGPRRILADFLIGAHATCRANSLLTLDTGIYRSAFPELRIRTF